jgi:hypothetical protein
MIAEMYTEEYHSLAKSGVNKKAYPIFINPTRSEVKELAKENNIVRFISHKGDLYAFSGELLHAHAIKHLELPVSNDPPIKDAFLGIAKASANGSMEFYDTNQSAANNIGEIIKHHSNLARYFGR